uniref:Astacin domain-containing protein n=1 Tax=Parastrongyloides trichosuri TaxID=131310 RepID=A0A0N4ZDX4_PARTI
MLLQEFFIAIVLIFCTSIEPRYEIDYIYSFRNKEQVMIISNNIHWRPPIEYHISVPKFSDIIKKVLSFLENNTCLLFSESTVPFDDRAGLVYECYTKFGCVMKYTLLSLGLIPPILREDRDQYVKINRNNTEEQYRSYFNNTPKESYINISNFPYDYSSITHPNEYYFSKGNGKRTIVVKNKNYSQMVGQEDFPSFQDIKIVNWHYCLKSCDKKETICYNGGYPNPHDCSSCICPTGFQGRDCKNLKFYKYINQDPFVYSQSGGMMVSGNQQWVIRYRTYNDSKVKIIIKSLNIKTPNACSRYRTYNDSKVKIIIKSLNIKTPNACSEYRGFQVKFEADKSKTGIILCNRENVSAWNPINITSEDNSLIVLINLRERFDDIYYSLERVIIKNETTTKAPRTTLKTSTKKIASNTTTRLRKKILLNVTTKADRKTTTFDKTNRVDEKKEEKPIEIIKS